MAQQPLLQHPALHCLLRLRVYVQLKHDPRLGLPPGEALNSICGHFQIYGSMYKLQLFCCCNWRALINPLGRLNRQTHAVSVGVPLPVRPMTSLMLPPPYPNGSFPSEPVSRPPEQVVILPPTALSVYSLKYGSAKLLLHSANLLWAASKACTGFSVQVKGSCKYTSSCLRAWLHWLELNCSICIASVQNMYISYL